MRYRFPERNSASPPFIRESILNVSCKELLSEGVPLPPPPPTLLLHLNHLVSLKSNSLTIVIIYKLSLFTPRAWRIAVGQNGRLWSRRNELVASPLPMGPELKSGTSGRA